MCFGAIYWARLDRVVYASTQDDAAAAGFDDAHIYEELDREPEARSIPMRQHLRNEAAKAFEAWHEYDGRVEY